MYHYTYTTLNIIAFAPRGASRHQRAISLVQYPHSIPEVRVARRTTVSRCLAVSMVAPVEAIELGRYLFMAPRQREVAMTDGAMHVPRRTVDLQNAVEVADGIHEPLLHTSNTSELQ